MTPSVSQRFALRGHAQPVYALATAAPGSRFYSGGGDKRVAEWDLSTGQLIGFVAQTPASIYSICYLPAQHQLVIGQALGGIHIVDLQQRKEIHYFLAHQKGIFNLQFDSDSNRLFAAGADGLLTVWDVQDWSLLANVRVGEEKIRSVAVSSKLERIAVASADSFIRIYNYQTLAFVNEFKAHDWAVNSVCWHPQKPVLISGSKDAHLRVWDAVDDFRMIENIPAHNYAIYGIEFSNDHKMFATASRDKTIKLWDAHDFRFLLRISADTHQSHTHSVNSILWHSYENSLISAGDDHQVRVWDIVC